MRNEKEKQILFSIKRQGGNQYESSAKHNCNNCLKEKKGKKKEGGKEGSTKENEEMRGEAL